MFVFWPPAKCWKIRFWRPAKNRYFLITNPFEKFQFSACRRGGHFQTSKGSIFYDYIECIQCEAGMHTLWGLNVYSTRLEDIQHEVWKYTVWLCMRLESIHYEAWKYTLSGLNVYSMRPENIHCEAWMYAASRLKAYTMRPESIQYAASKYNSIRPGSLQDESWKYTVWLCEVSFMDSLNISYYSIKCVWIGSCLNCCLVPAPEELSKELKSWFGDI